jgi:hypothetical protein
MKPEYLNTTKASKRTSISKTHIDAAYQTTKTSMVSERGKKVEMGIQTD